MNPCERWPRLSLGVFPTPLHRVRRLRDDASLLLKRDDLTGFGLAGNKARPLEFLMADAIAHGCDIVVTGGAPTSNFAGACAHASAVAGLDCEVLVADGPASTVPIRLARACGAVVRATNGDRALSEDAIAKRVIDLELEGRHPYPVPRGGATPVGALGFASAAFEVRAQLEDQGVDPTRATIVLPVGSGASLAGFIAGSAAMDLAWRVVGVSVSRPAPQMESNVLTRAAACSALMGSRPATLDAFTIVERTGDMLTEERADGMGAARFMRESEGILLDPHYGIPTFEVAWTLPATAEEPVVLWQTGGIPAAIENLDAGDEHERRVLTPSGSM